MPSEKRRYINRRRDPTPPFEFLELRKLIPSMGSDRLAEILWIRAQSDDMLGKVLMVTVALQADDLERAKLAVDYALHFPEFVRYTESGHGQILEEIKTSLENLAGEGRTDFALNIARYAIQRAHEVAENFEEDWDWISSIESLEEWSKNLKDRSET